MIYGADLRPGILAAPDPRELRSPPPLAAYEQWLKTQPRQGRGRSSMSAAELRRLVVLMWRGESLFAAARAMGRSHYAVRRAYARLPDHLK